MPPVFTTPSTPRPPRDLRSRILEAIRDRRHTLVRVAVLVLVIVVAVGLIGGGRGDVLATALRLGFVAAFVVSVIVAGRGVLRASRDHADAHVPPDGSGRRKALPYIGHSLVGAALEVGRMVGWLVGETLNAVTMGRLPSRQRGPRVADPYLQRRARAPRPGERR